MIVITVVIAIIFNRFCHLDPDLQIYVFL